MYNTSINYKSLIYNPGIKHILNIYINGNKIDSKDIKSCKLSQRLFNGDEFRFGSVTAKAVELQLNSIAVPEKITEVYIESGISQERVPIGYFRLDEPLTKNNKICTLKLIDDMVKFDFDYDGSKLIIEKGGKAELIDIIKDICKKAEVEFRFYFFS